MGLFVKKENRDERSLYSLGADKTVVIAGLGNIGKRYEASRHNAGFICVDAFADTSGFPRWTDKKDLQCHTTVQTLGDTRVILAKPQTMMNLSGDAIAKLLNYYKLPQSYLVVVHDELDIPFGQIRTRSSGSSAGNNGIKSIIQHCGEDFGRVRIGINNEFASGKDSAAFVLEKFTAEEQKHLQAMSQEVSGLLNDFVFGGQLPHETRSFMQ